MPSPTPSERAIVARIAAHDRWAREENRSAATAPARAVFDQTFFEAADGDPVRAASLRRAHFSRMALKSAQSRRRKAGGDDAA